jgi:ankyrin repeat protein
MQQSITTEKISLLACITVGCGISLYIINQYGHLLLHWLTSFYHKTSVDKKNNSSVDSNNLLFSPIEDQSFFNHIDTLQPSIEQQNASLIIMPEITIEDLDKKTAEFLKKQNQTKGTTDLHRACQDNDIEKVKLLLQIPTTDINAKRDCITFVSLLTGEQQRGETPLHIACHYNNKEIVEMLLTRNDIDITIQNKDGDTSLHIACKTGNQEIVQRLLAFNVLDINVQNDKHESAIDISYLYKHKAIFELFFKQDNVDLTNFLSFVSESDYMAMIKRLLHKNIKLDNSKHLYIACKKGYSDIVILLLKYNENDCMKINDTRYNPLRTACKQIKEITDNRTQFVAIIQALLNDPFIDINIKNEDGFTVFHYAVYDCELLELLINKNKKFIDEQVKIKSGNLSVDGMTPLHLAMKAGNLKSVFLLLSNGADISVKNHNGDTPLALVCQKASSESEGTTYKNMVTQLLASSYVSKEKINSSECLYKLNLRQRDQDILKLLLLYGADPNQKNDKYGDSPILEAALYNLPLLNLFIDQYKGDVTQKDRYNQTVLYRAFMSKKIKNPNEINFFKNLNENEKNVFMKRELSIIVDFTPQNIFIKYPRESDKRSIKTNNKYIKFFNSFIATCINHGKIDITAKITNNKTLLDLAYEQSQKRYDGGHDSSYYFRYNELIVHELIQHVEPTTIEQAVDKRIALIYKEEPAIYYLKTTEEKENQKNYLREQIKKLNSHITL